MMPSPGERCDQDGLGVLSARISCCAEAVVIAGSNHRCRMVRMSAKICHFPDLAERLLDLAILSQSSTLRSVSGAFGEPAPSASFRASRQQHSDRTLT
jgi:hypothetical protein